MRRLDPRTTALGQSRLQHPSGSRACWTFDRLGPDGESHGAEAIHAITLANLDGEFATIVTAAEVMSALRV